MPKRIEHTNVDGVEYKICMKCGEAKGLNYYTKNSRVWDGLEQYCMSCGKERNKTARRGSLTVYRNLCERIKIHPNYIARGTKCLMTKEEFIAWYIPRHFVGCLLDRIDNKGHYEIGNLQLLSRIEHNFKLRLDNLMAEHVSEAVGERYCYSCKSIKSVSAFGARNTGVLRQECNQCRNNARVNRYREQKK